MIWLVLSIALWGAVHSWMASLGFKGLVRRAFGDGISRLYRLVYNLFSVLSLAPILLLLRLLPDTLLYTVPPPWVFFMLVGQLAAILCIIVTVLQVDAASFIGLRQLFGTEGPSQLVTGGFYRWIRHPLYLFGLLILWLTPIMTLNLLIVYLSLTAYLIIGAMFEERKLLREFGSAYAEYKARTPMIIPLPRASEKSPPNSGQ
jgi:protein-S-isoprenylcysteine O-methyltransferase Ste14